MPARTFTVAGTVAADVIELVRLIVRLAVGGPLRVTVPVTTVLELP